MPSKIIRYIVSAVIVLVLLAGSFSAGIFTGWFLPDPVRIGQVAATATPAPTLTSPPTATATSLPTATATPQPSPTPRATLESLAPDDLADLYQPYWEALNLVQDIYVDQPVDQTALMRGAIQGMLEALGDEHTSYMDPATYESQNQQLQGEYSGIGAWVDSKGDFITIISPMPGSPAEKAGLRAGDQILAVDGEDMTGVSPEQALQYVLGPEGTTVTLTIQREGRDPFDVTVTRAKIVVPSVESKLLEGNIAYVAIYTFGDTTGSDLHDALTELLAQKPAGLVLDLRGNGGGYLETAIQVASEFLPGGVIAYEEYGDGQREALEGYSGGIATQIPMVVLIDKGSASASEIVAGAIQDRGRGQLVGDTSYGKGSVQQWVELEDGQGAVRVTVALWLTPDGHQINAVGLTPDVAIALSEDDINSQRDPQLERAVQLLTEAAAR